MRIRDAIDRVDAVKPNTYPLDEKIRWLSYIDGIIKTDTIDCHEKRRHHPFIHKIDTEKPLEEQIQPEEREEINTFYTSEDMGKKLLAPYPYDELYVAYLKMKIDEENGETQRYNNTATMFNSYYSDYIQAYHRTHKPKVHHIHYR